MNDNNKKFQLGAAIAVVGVGVIVVVWSLMRPGTGTTPPSNTPTTTNPTPTSNPNATYEDGTYTATGNYRSPNGPEEVDVKITIKDQKVTAAEFTGKATNPTSRQMQTQFNNGFKQQVVGKPIKDISLTVINGSSLTPKGFMDALAKIKTQAEA